MLAAGGLSPRHSPTARAGLKPDIRACFTITSDAFGASNPYMTQANRIRILLGVLAVAIAAVILLWEAPEDPPTKERIVVAGAPVAATVAVPEGPLTASAYAERLKDIGVLLSGSDTTAAFYWATMLDSTASAADYGLLR